MSQLYDAQTINREQVTRGLTERAERTFIKYFRGGGKEGDTLPNGSTWRAAGHLADLLGKPKYLVLTTHSLSRQNLRSLSNVNA
jgi:hypothetical protein